MTETRTTSSTGGQKGVKAERHDLLPREGIEAIARVFGFGATKYADHNWRKGYEWSKSYSALQRHLHAFWAGETYDEESGLPHLAHAGFHVLVLLTWLEVDGEGSTFDDRYRPAEPEPEYAVGFLNPETGTTSDVPGGIGDLTHEVRGEEIFAPFPESDIRPYLEEIQAIARLMVTPQVYAVHINGDIDVPEDFGPDLLRKHRPRI